MGTEPLPSGFAAWCAACTPETPSEHEPSVATEVATDADNPTAAVRKATPTRRRGRRACTSLPLPLEEAEDEPTSTPPAVRYIFMFTCRLLFI